MRQLAALNNVAGLGPNIGVFLTRTKLLRRVVIVQNHIRYLTNYITLLGMETGLRGYCFFNFHYMFLFSLVFCRACIVHKRYSSNRIQSQTLSFFYGQDEDSKIVTSIYPPKG